MFTLPFVSLSTLAADPASLLVLSALPVPAHAQVTVFTAPFTGDATESFESFPNYVDNLDFYIPNPTSIFGGAASLSGFANTIYEPGQAPYDRIDNGLAQVADSTKGFG